MAYDASAANRIHSAETSSPRERASTVQQTAPTTATAPQIAIDRGLIRGLPPGVLVRSGMVIDMADSSSVLRGRQVPAPRRYPFTRVTCSATGPRWLRCARTSVVEVRAHIGG